MLFIILRISVDESSFSAKNVKNVKFNAKTPSHCDLIFKNGQKWPKYQKGPNLGSLGGPKSTFPATLPGVTGAGDP